MWQDSMLLGMAFVVTASIIFASIYVGLKSIMRKLRLLKDDE